MNLTNKHNFPEPIYSLLAKEFYDGSSADFSVTQLIDSPRRVQLLGRHKDAIEEDVVDRYWTFLGNMAHQIMETASEHLPDTTEQRYVHRVNGALISGKIDCHHDGVIRDYKFTSVWTVVNQSQVKKWTEQLNLYAWLLRQHNIPTYKLEIICFLRDWMEGKANENGYPNTPVLILPVTLWSEEIQDQYVASRVTQHLLNRGLPDNELTPCTSEETWEKPTKFALMKVGRKSAVKLFNTESEAIDYGQDSGIFQYCISSSADAVPVWHPDYTLVERPGERTRCLRYCPVSFCCNQWQEVSNGCS